MAAPEPEDKTGLQTTCLADVKPRPVSWLRKPYVPLGKLTLWAAAGGVGKSSAARDLAVRVTRGEPAFGREVGAADPADVLLIGVEDGLEDTVAPSLLAAGAGPESRPSRPGGHRRQGQNVRVYRPVRPRAAGLPKRPPRHQARRHRPHHGLRRPGALLHDHRTAVVQAALGPLAQVAEDCGVAIVLIIHFNKGEASNAVNRIVSSAAYVNTVRNAWAFLTDPEEPEKRLFLPIKRNLPYSPKGLAFCRNLLTGPQQHEVLKDFNHLGATDLTELGEQLARLQWLGEVETSADQVLRDSQPGGKNVGTVEACMEWLKTFVGDRAWPAKEILAAAKEAGYSFEAQKEAKTRLNQSGGYESKPLTGSGEWWFGKGPKDQWVRRTEQPK